MERRKFVVGLGALASGSAAAMGTGAFTSVTADRDVDVTVEGDAAAYLGLEPGDGANGAYAEDVGSAQASVNFDGLNDGDSSSGNFTDGGSGVNPNAVTDIDGVLKITNQGTQAVNISIDTGDLDTAVSASIEGSNPVGVGNSVSVDFEIDTEGGYSPSGSQTLTINANAP